MIDVVRIDVFGTKLVSKLVRDRRRSVQLTRDSRRSPSRVLSLAWGTQRRRRMIRLGKGIEARMQRGGTDVAR